MPVTFHPNNPIDALEKIITKEDGSPLRGEIDIYRQLYKDLNESENQWDIWHDLKLPVHSNTSNYYKKTSAQIDFLILSKYGVIILEVKGGAVSTKNNTFYYGKNFDTEMSQNPFRQVEGYKFTLKDKILNSIKNCFFCEAVAFPHVDYKFESSLIDSNLLWTKYNATNYDNSIETFLKNAIQHQKEKNEKHFRHFGNLTLKEVNAIKKILSPKIKDRSYTNSINTLEWLGIHNIEVLDGLYKNQRIMIEGPPGSGKTTMAKAFIDKQTNKRGIYLCWNSLLMFYTKSVIEERQTNNDLEITTFFRFFQKLNPAYSYDLLIQLSEDQFYQMVAKTIDQLKSTDEIDPYDFIVIDEAQDLFDRGLDLFINSFSGSRNEGLNNGNSLILYDIDQSYSNSGRDVSTLADLLSDYYAHFKLNENLRSAQNPEIRELSEKVLDNPTIIQKGNFSDLFPTIKINKYNNLVDLKKHIRKDILTPIREKDSSLRGKDCVLLVESTFIHKDFKGENLEELLIIKDIEKLTKNNIGDTANKLRYTSILKYKGLEKKNVYLVISNPSESNKYEMFVGLTRAILNVEINIIE